MNHHDPWIRPCFKGLICIWGGCWQLLLKDPWSVSHDQNLSRDNPQVGGIWTPWISHEKRPWSFTFDLGWYQPWLPVTRAQEKTMSSFTPVRNWKNERTKKKLNFRHLNCEYTICSICIENICCIIYHVSFKYFFSGTKTGLDVYDPHFCKDQRSSLKGSSRQNSRQSCFAR